MLRLDWHLDPLGLYTLRAAGRFPEWVAANPWLLGGAVVVLSSAVWILPCLAWSGRAVRSLLQRGRAALGALRESSLAVVLAVAGVLGTGMALLLIEDGRRAYHGNFTWSIGAVYVIALPLLVRLGVDLRSRSARAVVGVLFAVHLAAGGLHLWILLTAGHL
jgi:hypothetical protein